MGFKGVFLAPKEVTVSIIVPCYNEVGTIEKIVRAVIDAPPKDKEIIVVDDGSTDGTRDILKSCIESEVSRVIWVPLLSVRSYAARGEFLIPDLRRSLYLQCRRDVASRIFVYISRRRSQSLLM